VAGRISQDDLVAFPQWLSGHRPLRYSFPLDTEAHWGQPDRHCGQRLYSICYHPVFYFSGRAPQLASDDWGRSDSSGRGHYRQKPI